MKEKLTAAIATIYQIISHKKPIFIYLLLVYVPLVILAKWRLTFAIQSIFFAFGAVCGLYLLELAETIFRLYPSPFRTVFFCAGLLLVCVFVVTSSGSQFSSGLVLGMYLNILTLQKIEFTKVGNVTSWFQIVNKKVDLSLQQRMFYGYIAAFVIATILYLRA